MLAFVPVAFDLYRPLRPRLRWAMQCLVSFADHAGRCFPSVRRFALHAGLSKSAAQRDLAELVATGHVRRKRRPGGVYIYRIDRRFLPRMAPRQLSQPRNRQSGREPAPSRDYPPAAVPQPGTKEQPRESKNNQGRPRFAKPGMTDGTYDFERVAGQWKARVDGWVRSSGRFWLAEWGPKPNEPGCLAPAKLLQAVS